jgi:hypothetical protein
VIEGLGLPEVTDVQMNVPDHGAHRHAGPGHALGGGDQLRKVERLGHHHELATLELPFRSRPVRVDLDPQPVGIT